MKTSSRTFLPDLLAGLSVTFAALALGAAFGVMSGRGAFAGMIAAGVIPIVTGLFGGTRLSVSGPTGPMTAVSSVVIALAYDKFGGERLLAEQFITLVFMLTAAGHLLAGLLRTGRLIRFVPKTVILGFMSGIAMVIWVDQIKVLFGLDGKEAPTGTMHLNLAYSAITFLLMFTLNTTLGTADTGWGADMHQNAGNMGLADGSASQATPQNLQKQMGSDMISKGTTTLILQFPN